jgi:hypothetical protein
LRLGRAHEKSMWRKIECGKSDRHARWARHRPAPGRQARSLGALCHGPRKASRRGPGPYDGIARALRWSAFCRCDRGRAAFSRQPVLGREQRKYINLCPE